MENVSSHKKCSKCAPLTEMQASHRQRMESQTHSTWPRVSRIRAASSVISIMNSMSDRTRFFYSRHLRYPQIYKSRDFRYNDHDGDTVGLLLLIWFLPMLASQRMGQFLISCYEM